MDLTADDVRRTAAQNGMELSPEEAAKLTKGVNRGRQMSQVLRKYVTPEGEPAGTFSPSPSAKGEGRGEGSPYAPLGPSPSPSPAAAGEGILNLSLAQLAAAYRAGRVSPVEATQACLDRIEKLDGGLHAFITVTGELALSQARQAEADLKAGKDLGPLHGIPVALKDLYATKGIRTTAHSNVLREWVPDEDSTAAAKLAQAGTVLLGKLSMHEFAFGGPDNGSAFPPARNPWNPAYITGGSSSGSGGALAARMCFGSLGSDTGGSIRNPANMCGVAGIKPTYGLVSRHGVLPLSWSLDHCGPLARTVEDCAILLQAIAGHDPLDPASANVPIPDYRAAIGGSVAGLRLGVPRSWFDEGEGVDPKVLSAFEEAVRVLKDAGASVVEVDGTPFGEARAANTTILIAEAYAYHEENIRKQPHNYGPSVLNRVREGALLSAADYIQAQRCRAAIGQRVRDIMRNVDLILSPAGARPAQAFDGYDADVTYKTPSFTNAFNLTGLPAMSVPCGFTSAGLPIGLQIAGRAFEETTVFRLAHAYEQATDWHTRAPALD
ncbi:MAG TPA: amidase [Chloroflexota bacterium]|nr:amidase [Chloroflexota bacterium]